MNAMSFVLRTLVVAGLTLEVAWAQPWSVAATNRAPVYPPTNSWAAAPGTPAIPPPGMPVAPAATPPIARPHVMPQLSNVPLPAGVLAFDAEQKDYTTKPGEVNGSFVFAVTNTSAAEVSITYIQTSCGCTTAALKLPLKLAPGSTTEIPINMNVAGKNGTVLKTITVHTDQGHKVLLVKTIIPPPAPDPASLAMNRERNQMLAQADRQSVFKNDCARCHVEPVIGKMGHELFTTACGICHQAEHRASMVPDLHALPVTPNAEYWRFFIVNGKPATLMPAFAQAQGGPLSEPQINSLVNYLVKEFPKTKTNAPAHAQAH
jgi:cytochrome c553